MRKFKLNKAITVQTEICRAYDGIWARAGREGRTFQWILDEEKRICEQKKFDRLPGHAQRYVNAYGHALLSAAHMWALEWILYVAPDGTKYPNWDSLPEEIRQEFRDNKRTGDHRWKSNGNVFSTKPEALTVDQVNQALDKR